MDFKEIIQKILRDIGIKNIKLEKSKNENFGDLSFACFELAEKEKKNPAEIAKKIAAKIKSNDWIEKAEAVGPYVNFFMNAEKLSEYASKKIVKKNFGKNKNKGKILVEHTSTNPNASPHVGRARNAFVGDSISRILKFNGFKVETQYLVNDVGKQIAMLVLAAEKKKEKISFDELLKLYVEIYAKMVTDASIEKKVFELLKKMESGDKKTIKLFEKVCKLAIDGQKEILDELNIKFNEFVFESKYIKSKKLDNIIKKLKEKRKIKETDGRIAVNLKKYKLPMKSNYVPLTRANKTSLYLLRDVAYNIDKLKKAKTNIVVLGEDHKLYFEQVKSILDILDYEAPKPIFYSFVLLKSGKMSTRKGDVVLLTEFMEQAKEKAKNEILKRNPNIKNKDLEKISKIIGYGAMKFSILSVASNKNVIFDWEEALNFEGRSAPYIQYTYVRSKKILDKLKNIDKSKKIILRESEEIQLAKKMYEFPEIVNEVSKKFEIHKLANYLYELANCFNSFYENCPVTQEKSKDKKVSRFLLTKAYNNIVENGLSLLGIDVPDFM